MLEKDRIEKPSHYNKTNKPEGIIVLDILTAPYRGSVAFCIGQLKYIYRAGSKLEEGISQFNKMVEDIKKFSWYMRHLKKVVERDSRYLDKDLSLRSVNDLSLDDIVDTFIDGKPDYIKTPLSNVIRTIYDLDSVADVDNILSYLDEAINKCEAA